MSVFPKSKQIVHEDSSGRMTASEKTDAELLIDSATELFVSVRNSLGLLGWHLVHLNNIVAAHVKYKKEDLDSILLRTAELEAEASLLRKKIEALEKQAFACE
eukprot:tig00020553_g10727.t1